MDDERTEGGDRIYRYGETPERSFELPEMDSEALEKIEKHYEHHFGKSPGVYHEILSELLHIDVHVFPPTPERACYVLATTGMSDRPMPGTPPENVELAHAELLIYLPPDWPLFKNTWEFTRDDAGYWPVAALKFLARMPHEYGSFLSWGHTIPNGPDAAPIGESTKMGCWCLLSPAFVPEEAASLEIRPGKNVHFFQIVPLYREEMGIKLKHRMEGLLGLLEKAKISHEQFFILNPSRPNAAAPRGLFGWLKRRT